MVRKERQRWRAMIRNNYNLILSCELKWPSLSVQWFPDAAEEGDEYVQDILISMHTSGQSDEFLQIVRVYLPDKVKKEISEEYERGMCSRIKVIGSIKTDFECNRVVYNPLSPNIIAARTDMPEVILYRRSSYETREWKITQYETLTGHEKGGYGVDWSPLENGILISSGEDKKICYFDTRKIGNDKDAPNCTRIFQKHDDTINDVCFSYYNPNVFASAGDDKNIIVWDRRNDEPRVLFNAHKSDILCVKFSPLNEFMFTTSGADAAVKVWDVRKMELPFRTLLYHKGEINQVRWSPHMSTVLLSASSDGRVCLWDLSKEITLEMIDGPDTTPPELVFLHTGHTDSVNDVAWNPLEKWEVVSVAEDNTLQIWMMAEGHKTIPR